jgi:hypothetical protein
MGDRRLPHLRHAQKYPAVRPSRHPSQEVAAYTARSTAPSAEPVASGLRLLPQRQGPPTAGGRATPGLATKVKGAAGTAPVS